MRDIEQAGADPLSSNTAVRQQGVVDGAVFAVLAALSFSHFLNDMIQSLVPAIYPILKTSYQLSFTQVGLITLTFQLTASLLQPLVGLYTDRRPMPFSLAIGMGFTLCGLLLLSQADGYALLLAAAALVGMGSSVFHPESSRMARAASGGRHGLAQSVFQVGGNIGSSSGPLLAAFIVVPHGQSSIAWFSLAALLAILVLISHQKNIRREFARIFPGRPVKETISSAASKQDHELSKQLPHSLRRRVSSIFARDCQETSMECQKHDRIIMRCACRKPLCYL